MQNRYLTIALLTTYCLLAGFTNVEGEAGEGVSGRVIAADFFALGLFIPAILFAGRVRINSQFNLYPVFLGFMFLSLMISVHPERGLVEYLVHVFNFAVGLAVFNLVSNARSFSVADAIYSAFYAAASVALLGLLQFMFFPDWFGGRQIGGLVGTFRNTGQAGTFFGTFLALVVPALAAGLIRRTPINLLGVVLLVLCLLLTVKRAAMLGFGIGIVGMLLVMVFTGSAADRRRNIGFLIATLIALPLGTQAFDYVAANVEGYENRLERKVENFSTEEFVDKFFGENSAGALAAFEDEPLIGVGPGNIIGQYTEKYEIHSTPLSILASSGLLGFAAYLVFLFHWLWTVWRAGEGQLIEARYLRLLFPMLCGLVVSWGYTYHVRKREFWILYGITAFACWLVNLHRQNQPVKIVNGQPKVKPEPRALRRPAFVEGRFE